MNYDFRTKLTILFTLAVVVLATVGALVLMNANRFVAETEQAAETQKILEKIKASLYRLAMSESDLRGYLLYPDSTRRAAYEEDRDSLFVRLKELKALTGESHSLRERVDSVTTMVEILHRQMSSAVRGPYGKNGVRSADKHSAIEIEQMRNTVASVLISTEDEERTLLRSLNDEIAAGSRTTFIAFITGVILSFVLLVSTLLLVRRENALRNRYEEARRQSEGRYRHLVESATDIIYQADLEGRFTYVNPVAIRFMEYPETELVGKRYLDLILDGYKSPAQRFYRNQVARNIPNTYFEFPVLTKGGTKRWLGQNVQLLKDSGKVIGVQAVARDVTDRKRSEEDLRGSQRRLQVVIDTVSDGVTFSDEDGRFTVFNRRMKALTGYTMEEANLAKDFSRLIYPDPHEHQLALDGLKQVLERGSVFDLETSIVAKDGRRVVLLVSTSLVRFQDKPMFLSTYRDITDRKKTEEALKEAKEAAEAATKAKSEFLAAMSHEIRTPMNGVIGMTDLLLNTELNPAQKEFAETIRISGEALLTVINDILDFSKIESGKFELDEHPFELASSIEEVFHLMSPKALEKNLDLLYHVDPKIPPHVVGDVLRLRQIIFNLVGNGVKFTEAGEVYVAVKLLTEKDGRLELEFSVKDTGIGIPEAKLDRLFKAFSQVDSSTTRKFGGTGLGLAISSRLVHLMGGRIWVESTEGKGSTFFFTAMLAASLTTVPKVYLRGKVPELSQKRVLIVDDNPTNLHLLTLQCTYWDMIARSTSSPREALEWVRKGDPFDIAILDMQMPEMDGVRLGTEIRTSRTAKSLPMILLTSSGDHRSEAREAKEVFSAFVSKPIRQSQLYDIIVEQFAGPGPKTGSLRARSKLDADFAKRFPMKILVAEDNVINQKLILRVLQGLGYRAEMVENGREVLSALQASQYDLIFMDIHMPELDGLDTTRQIVSQYEVHERPVIVAMTADAMVEDRQKCLDAGMDDYVSKPINLEAMQVSLERWGTQVQKRKKEAPNVSGEKIDAGILRRLRELGMETEPAFILTLIETFLSDTNRRMERLTEALAKKDADQVYFEAHTLRGGSLSLGAIKFGAALHLMEEAASEGRLEGLEIVFEDVKREFENTRRSLEAVKNNGPLQK